MRPSADILPGTMELVAKRVNDFSTISSNGWPARQRVCLHTLVNESGDRSLLHLPVDSTVLPYFSGHSGQIERDGHEIRGTGPAVWFFAVRSPGEARLS